MTYYEDERKAAYERYLAANRTDKAWHVWQAEQREIEKREAVHKLFE